MRSRCTHTSSRLFKIFRKGDAKKLGLAELVRTQIEGAEADLARIVFSARCMFRLNELANKKNERIWGNERPNKVNKHIFHCTNVFFGAQHQKIGC